MTEKTKKGPAKSPASKRAKASVDPYRVPVGNAWDNAWKIGGMPSIGNT